MDLIAVDVGNTTVSMALFQADQVDRHLRVAHSEPDWADRFRDFLDQADRSAPVCISAVDGAIAGECVRSAGSSRSVLLAPDDFDPPIENTCTPPENVGLDRLFNAAAAACYHSLPAVVVDMGTAVTVDRVEAPGVFVGGAIAPGAAVSFRGLGQDTALLPHVEARVDGEDGVAPLGTDTEDAIKSGVLRGTAGLVERLVRDIAAGDEVTRIVTGGGAPRILSLLDFPHQFDEYLTLRGIQLGARKVFEKETR